MPLNINVFKQYIKIKEQGAVLNRIEEGIIISPTNTSATFDLQDNITKLCDDEVKHLCTWYDTIYILDSDLVR